MHPAKARRRADGERAMTSTGTPQDWAPDDPVRGRMIFVSGTCAPTTIDQLTPALELYQGGCVPQLRERLGGSPEHRARTAAVSSAGGRRRAGYRRAEKLLTEFAHDGVPREVLVAAEPLYAQLVTDIFWIADLRPYSTLHTTLPAQHWPHAAAVLDRWGWP